jgi:hypothetical protein
MAITGQRSIRMLERYTHPTDARKLDALNTFTLGTDGQDLGSAGSAAARPTNESDDLLRKFGGRREARTRDLRVANAALSQLS